MIPREGHCFLCIFCLHNSGQKKSTQKQWKRCFAIDNVNVYINCNHHTWDTLFPKSRRLSGSRPYVFHRSATTQEVGFLQKRKKEGGWFSAGNQRQGGFLPHRNIATPSAPVRGLYSQALEERGHIPVKPAHSPASSSSQTQHGSFWFCSRGPGSIYKWTSKWKWSSVSGGHNQFGVVQTVFLFCYVMRRLRHFFVFYY